MATLRRFGTAFVGMIAALCAAVSDLSAATIIRDTEIEATIGSIARPIFRAAGLSPDDVEIFIVQDDTLNAFVSGGQRLYLHTGLIVRAETPEELAGVIAHETGHIAGGHLSRSGQAVEAATYKGIIGTLLGAAAAVAGAPQLGTAIIAGGMTAAQRGYLAFSRAQEQSADQAAVTYLGALDLPPEGLLDFFHVIENQNLRITGDGNVYLRSHPLTRDRIEFVEHQEQNSPFRGRQLDPSIHEAYERSRVKLDAFLGNPRAMMQKYKGNSVIDRYARAIALYRVPDLDAALKLMDGLIREQPDDPYFHELKGQILFENGRIAESVAPLRDALKLRPAAPLIRIALGRALLEQGDEPALEEAAAMLREAARLEPDNPAAWRFLGVAEGRLGNQGPSAMALTESAILQRKKKDAELFVARAQQFVRPGDPAWIRLQDLVRTVDEMEEPRRG